MMHGPACRFCDRPLSHTMIDLGTSPLSNAFLSEAELQEPEVHFPLRVYVCDECFLVQLPDAAAPSDIFSDEYAYFSSYSDTWMRHVREYVDHMRSDYDIGPDDFVVEVASNDGYLLRYFVDAGIPVLGIDPAENVANAAEAVGVPTIVKFFGTDLARTLVERGQRADLLIGNNVLAHVPELNDFVRGLELVLAPGGILTMEFPHLLQLIQKNEFDTIYHEHFSYYSLSTANRIFSAHGLTIFDVAELPTHGGSLRIYARKSSAEKPAISPRVGDLLSREEEAGLLSLDTYRTVAQRAKTTKHELVRFLVDAKQRNETVVGYGAPAKGNTLLNYCGIDSDLLPYTVDRSPHKQGHFLPGTRIPVHKPEKIFATKPDYVLILPWNLTDEIVDQMCEIREWDGEFVVAIPEVKVLDEGTRTNGTSDERTPVSHTKSTYTPSRPLSSDK